MLTKCFIEEEDKVNCLLIYSWTYFLLHQSECHRFVCYSYMIFLKGKKIEKEMLIINLLNNMQGDKK